jgi:hypothetical protein
VGFFPRLLGTFRTKPRTLEALLLAQPHPFCSSNLTRCTPDGAILLQPYRAPATLLAVPCNLLGRARSIAPAIPGAAFFDREHAHKDTTDL